MLTLNHNMLRLNTEQIFCLTLLLTVSITHKQPMDVFLCLTAWTLANTHGSSYKVSSL